VRAPAYFDEGSGFMASDVGVPAAAGQAERLEAPSSLRPRVWPAVALVVLYWAVYLILRGTELSVFVRFLSALASLGVLTLGFAIWWLVNPRFRGVDRLLGVGVAAAGGVGAALLCDPSVGTFGLVLTALPWVFTTWAAWLVLARNASTRTRRLGLVAVLLLTWGAFTLVRQNGVNGEVQADLRWRWSPTAEALYRAERAHRQGQDVQPTGPSHDLVSLRPGDWPGFRGPDRDGAVHGVTIATDWDKNPPRLVWRQRVGPAWSSVAVVGDRLFTQEQRDESEAVVCLDAATGSEVWAHQDAARHWDGQAGAGPRATPTFADGRVYALGATGILNCLDAATGERKWSHNLTAETGAKLPIWGFSSSPLVVEGVVVVFAGGSDDKGLVAYRAASGEPAWTAAAGQSSYTSPQLASLEGQAQVLFFGDHGLTALDPASGAVLWEYGANAPGAPRSIQPHPVGPTQVLIGSENDLGTVLVDVTRADRTWTAARRWASRRLKPSYNDFVVHDGSVYGFDGGTFCCIDLQTGGGRWRDGRYGHGQVLLLADQALLLVLAESGEAVLVAAKPERHEELGRFQALDGKTWNHPVLAHGRLYVRNGEEMACYKLRPGSTP
jgi:hypothetical protein